MGYYVETLDHNFTIKPENFDRFFDLVSEMFTEEEVAKSGQGGQWGEGGKVLSWYSWVNSDDMRGYIANRDICAVFTEWGFEDVELREDGSFGNFWYNNKTGQEDLFLAKIAPVVEDRSYIDWRGEDGCLWRDSFMGGTLTVFDGQVVFPNSPQEL